MTIYGLQYDTVGTLPFTPALQAFYYNGRYAHRPYTLGRGRIWIDVTGANPGQCFWLDVETGDADPTQVPGWIAERGGGGVYCNRSTLPQVLTELNGHFCGLWLATLDGTTDPAIELPHNVRLLAVQAFPAAMTGINADLSVVVDRTYWDTRAVM